MFHANISYLAMVAKIYYCGLDIAHAFYIPSIPLGQVVDSHLAILPAPTSSVSQETVPSIIYTIYHIYHIYHIYLLSENSPLHQTIQVYSPGTPLLRPSDTASAESSCELRCELRCGCAASLFPRRKGRGFPV